MLQSFTNALTRLDPENECPILGDVPIMLQAIDET